MNDFEVLREALQNDDIFKPLDSEEAAERQRQPQKVRMVKDVFREGDGILSVDPEGPYIAAGDVLTWDEDENMWWNEELDREVYGTFAPSWYEVISDVEEAVEDVFQPAGEEELSKRNNRGETFAGEIDVIFSRVEQDGGVYEEVLAAIHGLGVGVPEDVIREQIKQWLIHTDTRAGNIQTIANALQIPITIEPEKE